MKALFAKLGTKKVAAVAAVVVIAAGSGVFFIKGKKADPVTEHHPAEQRATEHEASHSEPGAHASDHQAESHSQGLFGRIGTAFESIQFKVDQIRRLDLENAKLKLENAQLKLKLESSTFECGVAQSKALTEKYATHAQGETGTRVGRTLASIGYRAPTHLLPKQLYALGVTYLKAREFEKAAVIFTLLSDLPKDTQYKTPAHQVLTGTTWFKLKNYEMAEFYFDQVLKLEESEEALRYQAQARLWKAVIAHSRGKRTQAQFWMQELVDYHPRSPEAGWINPASASALEISVKGGHGERTPAEAHH